MELLLVDDDPNDRALTRRGLVQALGDPKIAEAGTSAELDAALSTARPDVAVIDYSLGWANGVEVFRRIRAVYRDCGVIMFTGSLGEEGAIEVMRAGIDDYFVKGPTRLPRLAEAIRALADRVEDRRARRRWEARHAALLRSSGVGILTCRADGRIVEANAAARRILGLSDGGVGNADDLLSLLRAEGLAGLWRADGGTSISGLQVEVSNGRIALLDAHGVPDIAGEVECVLADVTELRAAVQRSELLIREVYHRVYNNLQIMDALLALQAAKHSDPAVRTGYKDISQRLRALALVQQRLHRGDDFENIEFAAYLEDLAAAAAKAHGRAEVEVRVHYEEALRLPIDRALPLGLMVMELVTNAYKHAFPGGVSGRINITLARSGGEAILTVADDGVGAPAEIYGSAPRGGIGSKVVPQLAAQAGGELRTDFGNGTDVTVRLPLGPAD